MVVLRMAKVSKIGIASSFFFIFKYLYKIYSQPYSLNLM